MSDERPSTESTDFRESWYVLGDCTLRVRECFPHEKGGGVILFLHGRLGNGSIWSPIVSNLSQHFQCIEFDLPGFGRSLCVNERSHTLFEYAGVVDQLLSSHSADPLVLVGHDIGSAIAQIYLVQKPEKVAGVIFINGAGLSVPLNSLSLGLRCLALRWQLRQVLKGSSLINTIWKEELERPWRQANSRRLLRKIFEAIQDLWPTSDERELWRKTLIALNKPTLLLWGTNDPINPPGQVHDLIRDLPLVDFYQHPTGGHWPWLNDPQWAILKIREFIFRFSQDSMINSPIRRAQ